MELVNIIDINKCITAKVRDSIILCDKKFVLLVVLYTTGNVSYFQEKKHQ